MTEFTNSWRVFSYADASVFNLRFIRDELGLPSVNKIFRRSEFDTDGAFGSAVESAALQGNKGGYNVYQCLNQINFGYIGKAVIARFIESLKENSKAHAGEGRCQH